MSPLRQCKFHRTASLRLDQLFGRHFINRGPVRHYFSLPGNSVYWLQPCISINRLHTTSAQFAISIHPLWTRLGIPLRTAAPVLIWKWGAPVRSESGGWGFFGRASPLFGSKSTISRFGERFRDSQYSLFSQFVACCSSTHGAPVHHGVDATDCVYAVIGGGTCTKCGRRRGLYICDDSNSVTTFLQKTKKKIIYEYSVKSKLIPSQGRRTHRGWGGGHIPPLFYTEAVRGT